MHAVLEIVSGPSAGARVELEAGRPVRVGRVSPADLVVSQDPLISNLHFTLVWDGEVCRLKDQQSRFGTKLNGVGVTEAEVRDGDRIVAGQTTFAVRLTAVSPQPAAPPLAPAAPGAEPAASAVPPPGPGSADRLLEVLQTEAQPVFALLDAARDPSILNLLRPAGEVFRSLYEGADGELLAEFAPHLVALPARSKLLETLAQAGWGKSWGVYVSTDQSFEEVRRHFRRFLLVRNERGEELYFRYYDPRVLRVYLPTLLPAEAQQFFGPVRHFWVEAEKPTTLLRFSAGERGSVRDEVSLAPGRSQPRGVG
jgi:hypothetical protein